MECRPHPHFPLQKCPRNSPADPFLLPHELQPSGQKSDVVAASRPVPEDYFRCGDTIRKNRKTKFKKSHRNSLGTLTGDNLELESVKKTLGEDAATAT